MWFKKKTVELKDKLSETKEVIIEDVIFEIKRLDMLDYLNGSKVMQKVFDIYQKTDNKTPDVSSDKIKGYYTDVIMSGVIKPKLSRKNNDEGVCIEEIFSNPLMVKTLHDEILRFTYGKKNFTLLLEQNL